MEGVSSDRSLLFLAVCLIIIGGAIVLLSPQKGEKAVSPTPPAQDAKQYERYPAYFSSEPSLPLVDAPGTEIVSDMPRYPDARLVEGNTVPELGIKIARMMTEAPPREVALYYIQRLLDEGYWIDATEPLIESGEGWWGSFYNKNGDEYLGIIVMSQWIDLPPGGTDNPSRISIIRLSTKDLEALKEVFINAP